MIVKLIVSSDSELKINFDGKEYKISYSSSERNIFNDINKEIIKRIKDITSVELSYNKDSENESYYYKIANKIAETYTSEINSIRRKLHLKDIKKIVNNNT